ncbi:unnamed protein product [Lactuca saligna]|uniref:Uncharacterized protein n=1 Tax=Lactuca saligna TaxID=75948 RepID=A0AA35YXW9_LACSI|nr:unnamed protein product [Lactuca saligna]
MEVIPSKYGVLKKLKKMAHKPRRSPDRLESFSPTFKVKPQKKLRKLVIHDDSTDDKVVPESPIQDDQMVHSSFVRESPLNLNLEVTGNHDGSVETSKVGTPIIQGEQTKKSTPEKTKVIPPGVSNSESFHVKVHTLGITFNICNMEANVTMGDRVSNTTTQGNASLVVSSTFETPLVDTTISLPSFIIPTSTKSPPSTHSPTFDNIMQQPITSLFPSQSTEVPKTVNDDEFDDGRFVGSFVDIESDPDEEDIPDHILMSGKQFKIPNWKYNSLLQLQEDGGGKHSVSGNKVDVMLKAQEHQIQDNIDQIDKNIELRIKDQSKTFNGALRALKDDMKETHLLYVQDVKTIHENVDLKIQELRDDMKKEIIVLTHNYSNLHTKVDIIFDAITKAIAWYNSLIPKFEKKVEVDVASFCDIAKLLDFVPRIPSSN